MNCGRGPDGSAGYNAIEPPGVIRPMLPGTVGIPLTANQMFPSGPGVTPSAVMFEAPRSYIVMVPLGVIRPTNPAYGFPPFAVNQRLPSGPFAMNSGLT